MLRLSILAVTILAALANPGFAQDGSLLLACDRARSTAELRVFPFPSGTPSVTRIMPERRADCTLANGTTIRVKATPPQSASGPDCDSGGRGFAFSLWVNRQKIYSREEHQVCAGAVLRSLRVGPEGIVHCWYLRGRTLALPPLAGPAPDPAQLGRTSPCDEQPLPIAGALDDPDEYPPSGVPPRPPAGSLQLVASSRPALCNAMRITGASPQLLTRPREATDVAGEVPPRIAGFYGTGRDEGGVRFQWTCFRFRGAVYFQGEPRLSVAGAGPVVAELSGTTVRLLCVYERAIENY